MKIVIPYNPGSAQKFAMFGDVWTGRNRTVQSRNRTLARTADSCMDRVTGSRVTGWVCLRFRYGHCVNAIVVWHPGTMNGR